MDVGGGDVAAEVSELFVFGAFLTAVNGKGAGLWWWFTWSIRRLPSL